MIYLKPYIYDARSQFKNCEANKIITFIKATS